MGHRYHGVMTLAIYAKKCGVEEAELRQDAYSLLLPYDEMSIEEVNRFTREDVEAALSMFNEDYVTFPRDDIARLSGMPMPVNKRNWHKQRDHLEGEQGLLGILGRGSRAKGGWRERDGRPIGAELGLGVAAAAPRGPES